MKQLAAIYSDGTLGDPVAHEWQMKGLGFSLDDVTVEAPLTVAGGRPGPVVGVAFLMDGEVVGAVAAEGKSLPPPPLQPRPKPATYRIDVPVTEMKGE
jgi:hypothetical protein